jgi:hypothetical protein
VFLSHLDLSYPPRSDLPMYLVVVSLTDLPWAGLRARQDVEERLAKVEADLLCELVGVSTHSHSDRPFA